MLDPQKKFTQRLNVDQQIQQHVFKRHGGKPNIVFVGSPLCLTLVVGCVDQDASMLQDGTSHLLSVAKRDRHTFGSPQRRKDLEQNKQAFEDLLHVVFIESHG